MNRNLKIVVLVIILILIAGGAYYYQQRDGSDEAETSSMEINFGNDSWDALSSIELSSTG